MTSSRVDICQDRLDYKFIHPVHGQIHMLMRYKDIDGAQLDMHNSRLSFHVARPLHQFGSKLYDHTVPWPSTPSNQSVIREVGSLGTLSMVVEGEHLPLMASLLKQHLKVLMVVE
jgi:hypothetical protein